MKKLMFTSLVLYSLSTAWAAPNLELVAMKRNEPTLATIKINKGTHAFYKIDFHFMITDGAKEFKSHASTKGAYHPFFDKSYIINRPDSVPIGNIVKAEAKLIVQSCPTKEFQSCAVVKEEYLHLDIVDKQIVGIIPNQIDVTL